MKISGKVALVTGAARRVGQAIAFALASRGASVIVHFNLSRREAERTVKEIENWGVASAALKAEVSSAKQVAGLVRKALSLFKRIDILVNNAAIFFKTPFERLTEEDWDRFMNINLKGPFLFSKAVASSMLRHGEGKIINIADWAAFRPYRDYLPYCVSKAGVITLTQALAKTLAPKIQVNCVAPGPVLLPEDFTPRERKELVRKIPLRRIGSPDDIAEAVCFLIEGSDFITGATLTVDGGRLIA